MQIKEWDRIPASKERVSYMSAITLMKKQSRGERLTREEKEFVKKEAQRFRLTKKKNK